MTDNFDPDCWIDKELAALKHEFKAGRLNESDVERQRNRLLDKRDEMVIRLDGTYQI